MAVQPQSHSSFSQDNKGRSPLSILAFLFLVATLIIQSGPVNRVTAEQENQGSGNIFIPAVQSHYTVVNETSPLIHVPLFSTPNDEIKLHYNEMAIFWFGRVTGTENYSDVRISADQNYLYVNVANFDRLLYYDPSPAPDDLRNWDSVSLYLSVPVNTSGAARVFRFDSQLMHWETRPAFQAAFEKVGQTWQMKPISFTTRSSWQGNAPNDQQEDRGWETTFIIPFTKIGLPAAPASGFAGGIGIEVHDNDAGQGSAILRTRWPRSFTGGNELSWGRFVLGSREYKQPAANNIRVTTVREGSGVTVKDGAVGGHTTCGEGLNYWTQWGNKVYPSSDTVNIQNQQNLGDWPCFSRYYVTFPLQSIPAGKVIVSAELILHQFGGSNPSAAQYSVIQVGRAGREWEENNLSWNNSPQLIENYSTVVVEAIDFPGWPGAERKWNVSGLVADAYIEGTPMRLVLYSADWELHSGKYFVSSETGDWNAVARPTLVIRWGDAQ